MICNNQQYRLDCCEFRRRAASLGIHTVGRRLTSTPLLPIRPRVVVNITYACNLACPGCSHACFHKPPIIPAMSVKNFAAMLDDLCHSKMPLAALCLMGGEPTLHPRFTEIVALAAEAGKARGFYVKIISNSYTEKTRQLLREVTSAHDNVKASHNRKRGPSSFVTHGRSMFISPLDMNFPQPHPCEWYGGHFCGGIGVDALGYTICAMGGAVDTLLDTNVRVQRIDDLLDRDVQLRQVKNLCAHCGAGVRWGKHRLLRLGNTPVSPTWQKAFAKQQVRRLR